MNTITAISTADYSDEASSITVIAAQGAVDFSDRTNSDGWQQMQTDVHGY